MSINRLQPDRSPQAVLSERERTRLGRSGCGATLGSDSV